ncbi:M28 family metallopeptidase, partial [bacterium]|nr:M28 family metallopeptidase [bacterium]
MKRALLCSLVLVCVSTIAFADPTPFPANPTISGLVSQVDQDNLNDIVTSLVGFHTRHTYSDTISDSIGIGAARRWVRDQYTRQGIDADLFPWNGYWGGSLYDCFNVHATLQGQSGRPDLIIFGGHLDSRTVSSSDTASFAPGADDDASSIAAMMEIARILNGESLNTTLVTSSFAGEEQGLLGAYAYAQSLVNANTPVKAMLNMDMIGHIVHPSGIVDSMTVRCYSGGPMSSTSRQLARYVKWVGEAYAEGVTVTLYDAIDRPGRSGDHVAFYNSGYPSIRLVETAEDVAYQHNVTDLPEYMSFSYAGKVAKLCMGVAVTLAQTPDRPPAPEVTNVGNGESLTVGWSDSLSGTIRISYRTIGQLYWEDVVETVDPPPYQLDGLQEGTEYCISLSLSNVEGLPGPFGDESNAIPIVAPPPEDFETTSTPASVELTWSPRPEATVLEYVIYRTDQAGLFAEIATVPHPDSTFSDPSPETGQMYYYQIKTRNNEMVLGAPTPVEEGQLATHHLNILLVDATPNGTGGTSAPPDEEVDLFYLEATENFIIEAMWDRF